MELGNRDRMQDDDHSSVSSFAVVGDHHYGNDAGDESDTTEPGNLELYKEKYRHLKEGFSNTPSPSLPVLFQVGKVKYQDLLVRIFSDSLDKNPRQFFFEPLVLLDPSSIVNKAHGFFKSDFIQFTIQMWNEDLRGKVLERLRSMKSLKNVEIDEDDVCVMPYEEVQLVCKSASAPQSIRLMDQPTSYLRSKENLDFYLLCDVSSSASALAEDFRQNPEFTLNSWKLALECRGLGVQSGAALTESTTLKGHLKRPIFQFNVSIHHPMDKRASDELDGLQTRLEDQDEKIKGMEIRMDSMTSNKTASVFSAKICTNPTATAGTTLGFSTLDFKTLTDYGHFDLAKGIFTVKTPGIYQFNFSSHIYYYVTNLMNSGRDNYMRHYELRVDGAVKAIYNTYLHPQNGVSNGVYNPVLISALLPLKLGEKVGVFSVNGPLHEDATKYITRFSCVFVSDQQ